MPVTHDMRNPVITEPIGAQPGNQIVTLSNQVHSHGNQIREIEVEILA